MRIHFNLDSLFILINKKKKRTKESNKYNFTLGLKEKERVDNMNWVLTYAWKHPWKKGKVGRMDLNAGSRMLAAG